MADDWYYKSNETQHGPMSFAAIRQLAADGIVHPSDKVRTGNDGAWRFADSIPHLFPLRPSRGNATHPMNETAESRTQSPADSQPVQLPPIDSQPVLWFYKLADRARGPLPLEELRSLAEVSGETAREIVVRRAGDETWIPLDAISDSKDPSRLDEASRVSESAAALRTSGHPATQRSARSNRPLSTLERTFGAVRRNQDLLAAGVLLVALNAILFAAMRPALSQEQKYFANLQGIVDELDHLSRRPTSAEEWQEFRTRAEASLQPMVRNLEESAGAAQPIRQHLLWAGRDHLMEMLAQAGRPAAPGTVDDERRLFDEHMGWLQRAFIEENATGTQRD
ncbi:MAG: DUF4339 domain-containing protein [Planctomycetaceae bacterium]